ncbi:MAG: gamma-glutamyltransferase [Rhodospirillales bacterium]|nr:gamma-glutamyltransferase [Rhodospirillales bacterium]MDP6883841.1 gamma-glutamyltransferase [Rhodospirillales bacterium]
MAPQPLRPTVTGTRHVIVAGHYLASQAGFQILEAGGNAIDAGVAAGIALSVVESEMVSFAGVAPIILYMAEPQEIVTISGLGGWPRAASCEYFHEHHGGAIPKGIARTVVPGAPDAWITALERYGTMAFGEVAADAIRFARGGIAMYPLLADWIASQEETLRAWPTSAAVFLPKDRPPGVGELFVQDDLGRMLQFLADEEAAHAGKGRAAGLEAVRHAFYRGDIAAAIVKFHEENNGLMTAADLAEFRVGVEPPVSTRFADIDVYGCGPWCQGPMLLQELNIVEELDLADLGHNAPAYIHGLTEAIKLAAADRDAHYGDPRFVDVPIDALLDKGYAARRRALIRPDKAWAEMPPAGDAGPRRSVDRVPAAQPGDPADGLDTSYVCVVDKDGNAFSATPSDSSLQTPLIPGLGLAPSPRGAQSWTDPAHTSAIAPGKRPRLTPNPALAIRPGETVMPFGTPGGDVQTQMMLQVFLNVFVFGMDPQTAVEAPRFATHSFPATHAPHAEEPGSLYLQGNTAPETAQALAALGHDIHWWPEGGPENTSMDINGVCLVRHDVKSGLRTAGADPRRVAYGLGW